MKKIHIIGGGTFSHIRNHLSLGVPAFGTTAKTLYGLFSENSEYDVKLHLTKMADSISNLITNDDVSRLVDDLISDNDTKVIIFNVALCDFSGQIDEVESGKYSPRLKSRFDKKNIILTPTDKIISRIRKERKDIFLVAFKTTCGASIQEQYYHGLDLLKSNSCNLVFANDTKTRTNMIVVPEEAKYSVTTDRQESLEFLVKMVLARSPLKYTRSDVVQPSGQDIVKWNSCFIPSSLRTILNFCIDNKAYKPFKNKTAGHFAVKIDDNTFLTSKRSTNFNDIDEVGLVKIMALDDDKVIAYGAKPSVGGQSQRIIFNENSDVDCIVHFHCPLSENAIDDIPIAKQWPYECGSHECGQNTSDNLKDMGNGIKAVYLEEHGPNIVFNKNINPQLVIDFIKRNFDLSNKTGGLLTPSFA